MAKARFMQKVADELCLRLTEGEPLRQICRDEHMPAWRTVYDWIDSRPEFAARFSHARGLGLAAIMEECLDIADNQKEDVKRSKLRVWTRLQLLAKWDPSRYGARQQVDLKADVNLGSKTEAELEAELAALGIAIPAPHQSKGE